MVLHERILTPAEFDAFVQLSEHGDQHFELIDNRIYPVVSNNKSSRIAANILILVGGFVMKHSLGYVTGADGGYVVLGQRYIPDVAFMSKARQAEPSDDAYNPLAPDLAIEVLSPTDNPANVRIKLTNYLTAGTVVWIVDPETRTVEVYVPNASPRKLTEEDSIAELAILRDFELPVQSIFE